MTAALDLGASAFRCIRRACPRLVGRTVPTAYLAIPHDEANIALLRRLRVVFHTADDSLLVLGDEAVNVARILKQPLIPLFTENGLSTADPVSRQVLSSLIESVLPPADGDQPICVMTIPQNRIQPGDQEVELATRVVRLLGYQPVVAESTQAVIFAEGGESRFDGLGVSFGAGAISIGLAKTGQLVATSTTDQAGDWIDGELAKRLERFTFDATGQRYLDLTAARTLKSSVPAPFTESACKTSRLVTELYEHALDRALQRFSQSLRRCSLPRHLGTLPVFVCGGSAALRGFDSFLAQRIGLADLPVEIRSVRIDDDPWAVARGCLIHAELEQNTALACSREVA